MMPLVELFVREMEQNDTLSYTREDAYNDLCVAIGRLVIQTPKITPFSIKHYELPSIVYYLQRQDQAIKIGYTTDALRRKRQLELKFGPLDLLAWELGDEDTEKKRHTQFMVDRIDTRAEWFRPGNNLLTHVGVLNDLINHPIKQGAADETGCPGR